jgi:hypothetical protein
VCVFISSKIKKGQRLIRLHQPLLNRLVSYYIKESTEKPTFFVIASPAFSRTWQSQLTTGLLRHYAPRNDTYGKPLAITFFLSLRGLTLSIRGNLFHICNCKPTFLWEWFRQSGNILAALNTFSAVSY